MMAALDRAQRDGIDHQPRLEARLDGEQSPDFTQHRHSLRVKRIIGSFGPFAA
jgi:hypothetical protein